MSLILMDLGQRIIRKAHLFGRALGNIYIDELANQYIDELGNNYGSED